MKRFMSLLLVWGIVLSCMVPVFASDNKSNDILGAAKGFLGGLADDASKTVGDFWDNAATEITSALESTGSTLSTASAWTSAFFAEQGSRISESTAAMAGDLSTWFSVTGEDSLEVLHTAFIGLAAGLNLAGDQVSELWDTMLYYAELNNITPVSMAKLTLAIMATLALRGTKVGELSEDYVWNTLETWFQNFDITDEESAEAALEDIEESMTEYLDAVSWVCPDCGQENTGNFCSNCGAPSVAEQTSESKKR